MHKDLKHLYGEVRTPEVAELTPCTGLKVSYRYDRALQFKYVGRTEIDADAAPLAHPLVYYDLCQFFRRLSHVILSLMDFPAESSGI